ncbi:MAG: hypothetical protein ABIH03_03305 [Pseudomonadota bacterium]
MKMMTRSAAVLVCLALLAAGCASKPPVGDKDIDLANAPRADVARLVKYGTTMDEVDRYMKFRDRVDGRNYDGQRNYRGMQFKLYRNDAKSAERPFDYWGFCFNVRRVLVGKSQRGCDYVADESDRIQHIRDELLFVQDYERARLISTKLRDKQRADAQSLPLMFAGQLPINTDSGIPLCPFGRERASYAPAGGLCGIEVDPGVWIKYFNPNKFADSKGEFYAELKLGRIYRLAMVSSKVDQKEFSKLVMGELVTLYGPPQIFDETQVSDDRARFHAKQMAYWVVNGVTLYFTNYGHLSGKAMFMATVDALADPPK